MKAAPKDFKITPRGAPGSNEDTSTNVAYMTVDVAHGQDMKAAIYQIKKLADIMPRSWFCDVVHAQGQFAKALFIVEHVEAYLRQIYPQLQATNNIVVRMNHIAERKLRARDELEVLLKDHQTKNVEWKGTDEKTSSGILLS